jgi:hypothetical protein
MFRKQFHFVSFGLKIMRYGNPHNYLGSPFSSCLILECTLQGQTGRLLLSIGESYAGRQLDSLKHFVLHIRMCRNVAERVEHDAHT